MLVAAKHWAQSTHSGKGYDYSKVEHKGGNSSVIIVCQVHEDFAQNARSHIRGSACPDCASCRPLTLKIFSQCASQLHNERYTYGKADYINNYTKVTITCPMHGDFAQLPMSHVAGKGCMGCFSQGLSRAAVRWIQYMSVVHNVHIQHAEFENGGEHTIKKSSFRADGYAAATNTVYDYYRGWFHGDPRVYPAEKLNSKKSLNCTFGELCIQINCSNVTC